jgi:hypothetical protein
LALVLAICIRLKPASIMRAPPLLLMITSGHLRFMAWSAAMAIFSPTTLPMLPPMKRKSMQAITTIVLVELAFG